MVRSMRSIRLVPHTFGGLVAGAMFVLGASAELRREGRAAEGAGGHSSAAVGPWRRIEGARFDQQRYADGDSFVLIHHGTSVVYRLYFVDAPETDRDFPERVREQSQWFGVAQREIPRLGQRAAQFTAEWLRAGPVTVWTRDEPAGGREGLGRRYALIARGTSWLHEALVSAGWARVYGYTVDLPDGTTAVQHRRRLEELEAGARTGGVGAWAESVRTQHERERRGKRNR